MNEDLRNNVLSIITGLEHPELNEEGEETSAYDYLEDALDINWILNSDRSYKGARILVAFGGPNIWIDTTTNTVEGYWWGDKYSARFDDQIGLDEALEELFAC